MVVFGLVLLLIGLGAGGWIGWLALQSDAGVTLGATGLQLTVLPITLFGAGAVSMLLLWLGWRVMAAGVRRRGARRRELETLRTATAGASGAGGLGRPIPTTAATDAGRTTTRDTPTNGPSAPPPPPPPPPPPAVGSA